MTMPELLIDFITSLDGYASADDWPGWWGLEGPEYLTWLGAQPEADYTVLMGATTYRVMSRLAVEGEPGTRCPSGNAEGRLLDHIAGAPFLGEHATRSSRPR